MSWKRAIDTGKHPQLQCRALFHVAERRFWTLCVCLSVLVPVPMLRCDAPCAALPLYFTSAFRRRCHGGDSSQSQTPAWARRRGSTWKRHLYLVASRAHQPPKAQCRNPRRSLSRPYSVSRTCAKVPGVLVRGLVRPLCLEVLALALGGSVCSGGTMR
ncbi:hypothetical protein M440DRAFT_253366 [Trichoderma longibrachiatum ATCC 18648]|uniref:Uncharacterized protein n=1 Tax=Trichoderma longibrachiatum ATCC 18648 TaxID=983965 RepID=A0A2T4C9D6_TRILO|nr:hypothetical protein M440DRAFT_253366 [Trichoderma longibrachiatum ATCC 18648]